MPTLSDTYYPANDERKQGLYDQCEESVSQEENLIHGSRLAMYRCCDRNMVIETASEKAGQALNHCQAR